MVLLGGFNTSIITTRSAFIALSIFVFSFHSNAQSPGGVSSNLVFWLQADAGTNSTTDGAIITSWSDQSGNANGASNSGTGPSFVEVSSGYNPSIDYSTTGGGHTLANDAGINTTANSQKSYTIVFTTGSDITTRQLVYEEGGGTHGLNLYIESGLLYANLWVSSADNAASTAIEENTTYTFTFVYDGGNSRWDGYLNGTASQNDATVQTSLPSHTGSIGLGVIVSTTEYDGNIDVASGEGFFGKIHEFSYYNATAFSATERRQIETYHSLKYGVPLESDFLASDGTTTIWNTTTNTGYNSGVTGIGRDDANSDLNQKQNKSQKEDGIITFGLGSVASSNSNNGNTFSAVNDFMLWGHNNGTLGFTNSNGSAILFGRVWKVQETGTVGTVQIQIPASTSGETYKMPSTSVVDLLVDDNANFTSPTSTSLTLNGTNWEGTVDLSNADFFTLSVPGVALSTTTQGDEDGPVDIVFTVTLPSTNSSGSAITFDIDDLGTGSATSGSDYIAIPANAVISVADGQQSGDYTLSVIDDLAEEFIETVEVSISNPSDLSYTIVASSSSANISDDDIATPAGVTTDLIFWFRSTRGPSSQIDGNIVNSWQDLSGNNNNANAISSGPTYSSVSANFNPAVNFSTGGLTMDDNAEINHGSGSYNAKSYIIALKTSSDVSTRQLIYEQGGGTNGMNIYINSGQLSTNLWNNSADNATSFTVSPNTTYVISYVYDGDNTDIDVYVDGSLSSNLPSAPSTLSNHSGDIGVGEIDDATQYNPTTDVTSGDEFLGDIMEFIYYDRHVFTSTERLKLESYLALKHGITLSTDYLASDGTTTFWDLSANVGYNNDIAGIGADGTTGFGQKQSKSNSGDALITMGVDAIAVDNVSNTGLQTVDLSFLVWGNDDGNLEGVSSNSGLVAQSGAADQLQRTWKIIETGTVDSVQFAIPKDSIDSYFTYSTYGSYSLRVADDAGLSTNIVDVELTETTINGVVSYVGKHDFSGTSYFTVAQKGLILWTGSEWRGGLSTLTNHGPSDETDDQTKELVILSGTTAELTEAVSVNALDIDALAVLNINQATCLTVSSTATNNGSLSMQADNSGYGQYNGPAVTLTFEQYIDNEGWHLISSPFSNTTIGDISFDNSNGQINHPLEGTSQDTCNYCNMWWYDPSSDIGTNIGFGSSNAFGTWRSSVNSSESFTPTKGWNLYLDGSSNFGTAPWTVSIAGSTNDGDIDQTINENNGGWNLVANPYPCALDWDAVDDDLTAANIALGYHVWDETNTNYAVYSSGVGTLGSTRYLAPFQGFYVQTSTEGTQGSSDVFQTFTLQESDRSIGCNAPSFFKTDPQLIKIRTRHNTSQKIDETIIKFTENASPQFGDLEDINKLFSSYQDITNVYSKADAHNVSINSMGYPIDHDSVYVGVRAQNQASASIEIVSKPDDMIVYLEDIKSGIWYNSDETIDFTIDQRYSERFLLHFGGSNLGKRAPLEKPYSYLVKDGILSLQITRNNSGGNWAMFSLAGRLVKSGSFGAGQESNYNIDLQKFQSGIYILKIETNNKSFSEKVPVAN